MELNIIYNSRRCVVVEKIELFDRIQNIFEEASENLNSTTEYTVGKSRINFHINLRRNIRAVQS